MLCPNPAVATRVNGRTYTGVLGTPQDVPDFDAKSLEANGWVVFDAGGVGTTAQRPTTGLVKGLTYSDTTLGYSIVWDGTNWRNMAGATA